jgi:prohibitin 2
MTIIKAQGEAIAAANLGVLTTKNPAYLDLKRIEAVRNQAHILSTGRTRVFVDSDTLLLNLTQGLNEQFEKKTESDLVTDRQKAVARN